MVALVDKSQVLDTEIEYENDSCFVCKQALILLRDSGCTVVNTAGVQVDI